MLENENPLKLRKILQDWHQNQAGEQIELKMCEDERFCGVTLFFKLAYLFDSAAFAYDKIGFETPRDSSG